MIYSALIHLLCVCVCVVPTCSASSPLVAVVIHDDRGGADASAPGVVPKVTLMAAVTTAE